MCISKSLIVPKNIIVICGKPERKDYETNTLKTEVNKTFNLWEFIFLRLFIYLFMTFYIHLPIEISAMEGCYHYLHAHIV